MEVKRGMVSYEMAIFDVLLHKKNVILMVRRFYMVTATLSL